MERIDELSGGIISTLSAGGVVGMPFYREVTEKELSREPKKEPVMLVAFDRAETSPLQTATMSGKRFIFRLYAMAKNLSGNSSASLGMTGADGVFALLESSRLLLLGSRLGLPVQPLQLLAEKPFIKTERMTVYLQEWQVEVFE